MQYMFKTTEHPGQSRAADADLAFAAAKAHERFALAAHSNVGYVGMPYWNETAKITTYGRLMQIPTDHTRRQPLKGWHIESEARRQEHRLLREDFDAAWGDEGMVQRYLYRGVVYSIYPRQPVNAQPSGFARLDEAFEETFGVE